MNDKERDEFRRELVEIKKTTEKIIKRAKLIVDQWDNHDIFRQTESDKSFYSDIGEPDTVAIARMLLDQLEDIQL